MSFVFVFHALVSCHASSLKLTNNIFALLLLLNVFVSIAVLIFKFIVQGSTGRRRPFEAAARDDHR